MLAFLGRSFIRENLLMCIFGGLDLVSAVLDLKFLGGLLLVFDF